MQFTAVWLKNHFPLLSGWSLNDVCCYIPAWFGVIASTLVGIMAYEASLPVNTQHTIFNWIADALLGQYRTVVQPPPTKTNNTVINTYPWLSPAAKAGMIAMAMMAIVPAHLTRSMGGGYDNESIAVTAMCATFCCWMKSLRSTNTVPVAAVWGVLTGIAYFYMVAAWGTFTFFMDFQKKK